MKTLNNIEIATLLTIANNELNYPLLTCEREIYRTLVNVGLVEQGCEDHNSSMYYVNEKGRSLVNSIIALTSY